MEKRYWVPAIERANLVLNYIARQPGQYRLIDLSNELHINKSTMFSLLNTLETLNWIVKMEGDTYSLGHSIGSFSNAYIRQFNILQAFYPESSKSASKIKETIQLGILEGSDIFYLGKNDHHSRVRLATDPGMHFPAHATAIGKIQLAQYTYKELKNLYPNGLIQKTMNTITNIDVLWKQLEAARIDGFITEAGEGTLDFYCVAAPIYNNENKIIAGVSFSMTQHSWNTKKEAAKEEIMNLADRISRLAGKID